ncbi:MAG: N-acetyl-gamma-glutamyl-phosphate reductase [Candidatus Omnitrophota bacterium]|nr:MAG: N-acetyl-gamma-glutamyl-phosphate reductase [Candidatus Omnitrophota bacterium]
MEEKIKVAILGATGFTGEKLVELLLKHPGVEITYLGALLEKPTLYSKLFPKFEGKINLICELPKISEAVEKADIFFLALPHTISFKIAPSILKAKKKVIDLSADYRLKNSKIYEEYYKKKHQDKRNLKQAVYGLVEFLKEEIKKADLIANPGCYPISVILALVPLLKEDMVKLRIIVDSKSSVSGGGRKPLIDYHYLSVSNNIWAYKPFFHQHTPEIVEVLKYLSKKEAEITFIPHVVGIEAGIYSTIYVDFKKKIDTKGVFKLYQNYYRDAPFVRIKESLPKLKDVVRTNFCDIGFSLDGSGRKGVICSCIDNLMKGASGNAIQNMNVMYGFDETEGLL